MEEIEENSSESYENFNSTMAMSINKMPFVFVPFHWGRKKTETGSIFYTTPSGRVLLSIGEINSYFEEKNSCKCFIDCNLNFTEVFSFDPSVASLKLPFIESRDPDENYCDKFWSENIPKTLDKRQVIDFLRSFFKNYISKSEILSEYKNHLESLNILIHLVQTHDGDLSSPTSPNLEENSKPLAILNWKDFIVTKSGQVYQRFMTDNQLKHFVCEFIEKTALELTLPQSFFVFFLATTKTVQRQLVIQRKAQAETKMIHFGTNQKPKRGRPKILLNEDEEIRIEKRKAYQRNYRQQQKLKKLAEQTHQKEQLSQKKGNQKTTKSKTNRRSTNIMSYDDSKELYTALQYI